jgi:hypothetical protein
VLLWQLLSCGLIWEQKIKLFFFTTARNPNKQSNWNPAKWQDYLKKLHETTPEINPELASKVNEIELETVPNEFICSITTEVIMSVYVLDCFGLLLIATNQPKYPLFCFVFFVTLAGILLSQLMDTLM